MGLYPCIRPCDVRAVYNARFIAISILLLTFAEGFLMSPTRLKWLLNLYPPYIGAGVRVVHLAEDFTSAEVVMPLRRWTRNYVGVHFGGSLYSMTDPFFMLLVMEQLGRDYIVWDQAAHVEFIAPGKGTVRACFEVTPAQVEEFRQQAASGAPIRPELVVEVKGEDGELVARVTKTLYIRKKKEKGGMIAANVGKETGNAA